MFNALRLVLFIPPLTGCQISYIAHTAYHQAKLAAKRAPVEKVLQDPKVSETTKAKLRLVQEARTFAEGKLGLKHSKNYTQFVQLDTPYVSWIVHAAPAFELKSYQWWFPIVGKVPYKGYFIKKYAEDEAADFDPKEYDTFVRGVTAYSTLGWFTDPLLSSMLGYADHDLVNTVIHETVHATIYFKGDATMNERMATFLGDYGTELFYLEREGPKSPTVERIKNEAIDQKLFADFLSKEMAALRAWYKEVKDKKPYEEKVTRLKEIQNRFETEVRPRLKVSSYANFTKEPINNATLLSIGTYYEDLSDFEKLRTKIGPEFTALVAYLRNLAKTKTPASDLKAFVSAP